MIDKNDESVKNATPPPPAGDERASGGKSVPVQADNTAQRPFLPPKRGKRVLIYGEGGTGKTTLATKLAGKTLFFDLEGSLSDLFDEDTFNRNITPYYPKTWEDVEKALSSDKVLKYDNIVVDSLTSLETLFWNYIATHCRRAKDGFGRVDFFDKPMPPLKDEKELGGGGADSAKFAMWGRFESFMQSITAEGVNWIDICHDCEKQRDDSADGIDTKHQPRLNDPNSGKNSIRLRAFEIHAEVWYIKWEKVRRDERHAMNTGRRIILGQPNEENAADFVGVMSKSRKGFTSAYLDDFDINAILGIVARK